jgi:hypothetical protein
MRRAADPADVEIYMDPGRLWILTAALLAVAALGAAGIAAGAVAPGTVVAAIFLSLALLVGRRLRRPRPSLVFDAAGVHCGPSRLDLPWTAIADARHQRVKGVNPRTHSAIITDYLVLRVSDISWAPRHHFGPGAPDEVLIDLTPLRCDYDAVATEARRRIAAADGSGEPPSIG